jgi:hypothetical protein
MLYHAGAGILMKGLTVKLFGKGLGGDAKGAQGGSQGLLGAGLLPRGQRAGLHMPPP